MQRAATLQRGWLARRQPRLTGEDGHWDLGFFCSVGHDGGERGGLGDCARQPIARRGRGRGRGREGGGVSTTAKGRGGGHAIEETAWAYKSAKHQPAAPVGGAPPQNCKRSNLPRLRHNHAMIRGSTQRRQRQVARGPSRSSRCAGTVPRSPCSDVGVWLCPARWVGQAIAFFQHDSVCPLRHTCQNATHPLPVLHLWTCRQIPTPRCAAACSHGRHQLRGQARQLTHAQQTAGGRGRALGSPRCTTPPRRHAARGGRLPCLMPMTTLSPELRLAP